MADDHWYRNPIWRPDAARLFDEKLERSRSNRPQYLKIQASYLTKRQPLAALALLDRYFATGDELYLGQAHGMKAEALLALDRVDEALASYVDAVDRERIPGGVQTQAYLDFPCLVGTRRATSYYRRAVETLREFEGRPTFPIERYRYHGAWALLHNELGDSEAAGIAARKALAATRETASGFWRLPKLGLVVSRGDSFGRRVRKLAR